MSIPAPAYYAHLVAIRARWIGLDWTGLDLGPDTLYPCRYHIIDKDHDMESLGSELDELRFQGVEKAVQVGPGKSRTIKV